MALPFNIWFLSCRFVIRCIHSFLLCLCFTTSVLADETLLLSTSNVMPWGIEKPDGSHEGLLVELADAFCNQTGMQTRNRLKPYPRVINDIRTGQADVAVLFHSPESESIGYSLGEVASVEIIAVSKRSHKQISSLSDLNGERVAHVRGSKYGPTFDNHTGFHKVPVKNMNQGLRMLMKNHVDVVVSTDQSIYYGIENLAIETKWLKKLWVISTAKADLYLSKKSAYVHKIEPLKAIVSDLKRNGVLDQIFYGRDYISSQALEQEESWLQPPSDQRSELLVLGYY